MEMHYGLAKQEKVGDTAVSFDLFPGQQLLVNAPQGGPLTIAVPQKLIAGDFEINFEEVDSFPGIGNLGTVRAKLTLKGAALLKDLDVTVQLNPTTSTLCLVNEISVIGEALRDKIVGKLQLNAGEATLKLGATTPWELTVEAPDADDYVAKMELLGVELLVSRLVINAGGLKECDSSAFLSAPSIPGLNSVQVTDAALRIRGKLCHARLGVRFSFPYFSGSQGDLEILASRSLDDEHWVLECQTKLNTESIWQDPTGWLAFDRIGATLRYTSTRMSGPEIWIRGRVTFLAEGMTGRTQAWLGELFSGLSAEFDNVSLSADGLPASAFDLLYPLNFKALGVFSVSIPKIGFGKEHLIFEGLTLSVDQAGTALRCALPSLSLSLKGIPELNALPSIAVELSTPGGLKASGSLKYDESAYLVALTGEGHLSSPTLPGIAVTFRVGRFRLPEPEEWKPTILLYAQAAVAIPLFPFVTLKQVGLGVGINCEIEGTSGLTLAEARKRIERGLPDVSNPDVWVPGKTELTLVARGFAAATPKIRDDTPDLYVADVTLIITSDFQISAIGKLWLQTSLQDAMSSRFQRNPCARALIWFDGREPSLRLMAETIPDGLTTRTADGLAGTLLAVGLPSMRLAIEATTKGTAIVLGPNTVSGELGPLHVSGQTLLAFRSVGDKTYAFSRSSLEAGFTHYASVTVGPATLSASLRFGFSASLLMLGLYKDEKLLLYGRSNLVAWVGVSLHVRIGFSMRVDLVFRSFTISWYADWGFDLQVHVDLSVEMAVNTDSNVGVVGSASVRVSVLGIDAGFSVHIESGADLVNSANEAVEVIDGELTNLLGTQT